MKKRLLGEMNLTYTRAIEIATSFESATKDVLRMENSTMQKLEPTDFNYINRERKIPTKFNRKCFCCGKDNHVLSECRYKDCKCNVCKKQGHLFYVCKSGNRDRNNKYNNDNRNTLRYSNKRKSFMSYNA